MVGFNVYTGHYTGMNDHRGGLDDGDNRFQQHYMRYNENPKTTHGKISPTISELNNYYVLF